jgi:hypothetical protein
MTRDAPRRHRSAVSRAPFGVGVSGLCPAFARPGSPAGSDREADLLVPGARILKVWHKWLPKRDRFNAWRGLDRRRDRRRTAAVPHPFVHRVLGPHICPGSRGKDVLPRATVAHGRRRPRPTSKRRSSAVCRLGPKVVPRGGPSY